MVHCTSKAQKTYLYIANVVSRQPISRIFIFHCTILTFLTCCVLNHFLIFSKNLIFPTHFLCQIMRECVQSRVQLTTQYNTIYSFKKIYCLKKNHMQYKASLNIFRLHQQTAKKTGNCKKDIQLLVYYCVISFECLQSNSSGKIFFLACQLQFSKNLSEIN